MEVIDTTKLRQILGENVRQLRAAKGLSQQQLAHECGVRWGNISRIENGHQMPSAEVLYAIADCLGVDADALRKQGRKKIPVHAA